MVLAPFQPVAVRIAQRLFLLYSFHVHLQMFQ